jgi:hypothetical protein
MMIVNRRTFVVKRGRLDHFLALLREAREQSSSSARGFRAYTPDIGSLDKVALEWEYENLEEYERDWAGWGTTPESAALQERLYELTETGGTSEMWNLVEQS